MKKVSNIYNIKKNFIKSNGKYILVTCLLCVKNIINC
jgi:hypothetical protein